MILLTPFMHSRIKLDLPCKDSIKFNHFCTCGAQSLP